VLEIPLLGDESPQLGAAGPGAAAAAFALLAGDVVLPVPSSALMLLNGALFGPVGGALLSLAASEAAALLGWAIGRRGGRLLDRAVAPEARARVAELVAARGAVAIVVTRPVPIVAETAVILAGAAGMPLGRLALAAAVGSVPPAVAYALAGAYAQSFDAGLAVFAGVLVLAAGFWWADRRRRSPSAHVSSPAGTRSSAPRAARRP
jgi:uncharacterized membrane protein YdjX (TVP38/TMEM64 family)